ADRAVARRSVQLKADLHLHTRERDRFIAYDARDLIDRAARSGFQVLSITNHDAVTFSADLESYARGRGILLIPGVEMTIEGKHVLLYNADVTPERLRTFADLRRLRRPEWLVVAPHPFFPASYSLRGRLLEEIDLFEAIELSHFYTRRIDFNRPAVRLAIRKGQIRVESRPLAVQECAAIAGAMAVADCREGLRGLVGRVLPPAIRRGGPS